MKELLLEEFSKQANIYFYTSYLYYAMGTYFDEIMMEGFSKYLKHKASENLSCAQEIHDYLILRDEKLTFLKIDEPITDWLDVTDVFCSILSHEEMVLEKVEMLYKTAKHEDDIGAEEFVAKMLEKQAKNASVSRKIVFRIKNSNLIDANVEHLDMMMR